MSRRVRRPPQIRLYADELVIDGFAGGGGTSTGIERALGRSPDIAINHDPVALAMHEANHPDSRHVVSNIRAVSFRKETAGRPVALAWFSPDCTFHSKARGGRPFRDRNRARRIRGLAWEAVRCAIEVRPRVIAIENVEEFKEWCPLGPDGRPVAAKTGSSFRRWVARLRNLGYEVDWRELRACDFGAPTSRKRLFVIARCDGQPIVWPKRTHGPGRQPFRTAAECIDFSLPVPSIFLTPREAKAWGKAHGVASPKRPLAKATKRRIARGIQRFVLDSLEPFIIKYHAANGAAERIATLDEPITTIDTSNRYALVTPFLASVRHHDDCHVHSVGEPIRTIPASDREFVLVAPSIVRVSHGERDARGKKRGKGEHAVTEPLPTQTASNDFALMVPTLINTRNGERHGRHGEQAPRVLDIQQPFNTVTAQGSQGALVSAFLAPYYTERPEEIHARTRGVDEPLPTITTSGGGKVGLVAAFLAKHNGGHEATGQKLQRPIDTVVCRENKALVTSTLVNLRGGTDDHVQTAQDVRTPVRTLTAGGTHIAEVRAFLVKYYGTKKDGRPVDVPLDTITTKERYGLVTVTIAGEEYAIVDIGMRMLTPRELFRCQGFPRDYEIDRVQLPTPLGLKITTQLTKKAQTRLVGNSVPPDMAEALIAANLEPQRRRVA